MKIVGTNLVGLGLALIISGATSLKICAQQIDLTVEEKLTILHQRINQAISNNLISEKDGRALKTDLDKVNKKKKQLKAVHSDVLTAEDDAELDKELNKVNGDLEAAKSKKGK